jgi:hypothetical protein
VSIIGLWQGYFIQSERNVEENKSGSKLPIDVNITFKDSNNFIGHGSDDIGKFEFQKGKIRGKVLSPSIRFEEPQGARL